jgi:hypothetical protein
MILEPPSASAASSARVCARLAAIIPGERQVPPMEGSSDVSSWGAKRTPAHTLWMRAPSG